MGGVFDPRRAVLIVEDDLVIRMAAEDLVEEAGFTAYSTDNADDAIALLEAHEDIRIVFTDIELTGSTDGMKLAAMVRKRWPPVEIIVTSGRRRIAEFDLPERGVFFEKPYDREAVIAVMQRLGA